MSNRARFERFFADLGRLDFEAVLAAFAADGIYHDLPVPTDPAVGKAAILAKLTFLKAVERLEFRFSAVVEEGDRILAERVEVWHFPSGATASLPVMCTMEFRDGLVAAWREYWDFATLMNQLPPEFLQTLEAAAGAPLLAGGPSAEA